MVEMNGENFLQVVLNVILELTKTFYLNSKIFVLATGGIENSRILLLEEKRNKGYFHKIYQLENTGLSIHLKFLVKLS